MIKHLRFLSWAAVSSEEQASGYKESLPDQRAKNYAFVASLADYFPGYTGEVVAHLEMADSRSITLLSDAVRIYSQYRELEDIIRAGRIDAVVCRERSRLGRTFSLVTDVEALCDAHNVISVPRLVLPPALDAKKLREDESYQWTRTIDAQFAAYEIRVFKRRSEFGMIGRVQNGNFASGLPWGYSYTHDSATGDKAVVLDPTIKGHLRHMYLELYVGRSFSTHQIAVELNETGVTTPTGKLWTGQQVNHLLKRLDAYAGYVWVNRNSKTGRNYTKARGSQPVVFTEEELAQIRSRQQYRTHPGAERIYPLSGILICAECLKKRFPAVPVNASGLPLCTPSQVLAMTNGFLRAGRDIYQNVAGQSVRYYRYHCYQPASHYINISEKTVVAALLAYCARLEELAGAGALADLLTGIEDNGLSIWASQLEDLANAKKKLAGEEKRLDNAYIVLAAIDEAEYMKRKRELLERRASIEAQQDEAIEKLETAQRSVDRTDRLNELARTGSTLVAAHQTNPGRLRSFLQTCLRVVVAKEGKMAFYHV